MAYNEINVIAVGSVVMVVRTTKLGRFISLLNIMMFKNMRGIIWIQCYRFVSLFVTLRLMNFSLDIVDTFTSLPNAEIYHHKVLGRAKKH